MIRRLHEGKNMKPVITATVRSLRGLGRPSKTANARRLRARGESVGSLSIREATVDDVSALAQLHVVTWNATHGLPFGRRPTRELRETQWRAKFERGDEFCFVVQNGGGVLVGFASGLRLDQDKNLGFASRLGKLYLLADYQRLGLGRRLVGHVARRFLEQGISSMLLFSEAENPSCAFFEALGGERLLSDSGEFHGGYGWRDLEGLADACPVE